MFSEQFVADSPEKSVESKLFEDDAVAPNFYNWRETFPELQLVLDNIDIIKAESESIPRVNIFSFQIQTFK